MPSESIPPSDVANPDRSRSSHPVTRRCALLASGVTLAGVLAGCIDDGDGGIGDGDEESADAIDDVSVAIVSSPAGFHDRAFNDSALEGLVRAEDDFGVEINEVEETDAFQYESVQADLAESGLYDVVVTVGYQHYDPLTVNAEAYPAQRWMLLNDHVDSPHDNVSGWKEMNNEMAFLAGVAAGTLTREPIEHEGSSTDPDEGLVGFVGGEEIDLINAFEASYVQGVEWVDADAEVLVGYAGSFADTGAVTDVAESQFDDGADVVWHVASAAGAGAFDAARDHGRFGLGTDFAESERLSEFADVILGSAVKNFDVATYEVATAVVEDDWDRVAGERYLGVEDGGTDFVAGREFAGELPASLEENVAAAKTALLDGDVELACGPTGC